MNNNEVNKKRISTDVLFLSDIESRIENIAQKLRDDVLKVTRRMGAVVGISGGIDSSVTLALAVKALGSDHVIGVLLPEKDSSADSKELALKLARQLGVKTIEENITPALEGLGCYKRRDEAVKEVFPEYNPENYTMKIGINAQSIGQNLPPIFSLTIVDDEGNQKSKLLPTKEYSKV